MDGYYRGPERRANGVRREEFQGLEKRVMRLESDHESLSRRIEDVRTRGQQELVEAKKETRRLHVILMGKEEDEEGGLMKYLEEKVKEADKLHAAQNSRITRVVFALGVFSALAGGDGLLRVLAALGIIKGLPH